MERKISQRFFLWMLFTWLAVHSCDAQNPLRVTMISESTALEPGRIHWIGFRLIHPPGHHSYTQHPGGIGLATSVTWDLPPGFHAGEIHWPCPQAVMMGEHRAQGYRGEVLLMVPITIASTTKMPKVTLRAKLDWLCCGRSCHHAFQVPFSLTLPVSHESRRDPSHAPLFATARRAWPTVPPRWQMSFRQQGDHLILLARPPQGITPLALRWPHPWFVTTDGVIDSTQPQRIVHHRDGSTEIHLPRHELASTAIQQLRGLLIIYEKGRSQPLRRAWWVQANRQN